MIYWPVELSRFVFALGAGFIYTSQKTWNMQSIRGREAKLSKKGDGDECESAQ